MKIAIDCDGVLASFDTAFAQVMNEVVGAIVVPEGYAPTVWDWPQTIVSDEVVDQCWDVIRATPDWWGGLKPLPGAEAVKLFLMNRDYRDGGHEVYFVTSRCPSGGASVAEQTRLWLGDEVGWHGVLPGHVNAIAARSGTAKRLIYDGIGITYSLDDRPENVEACVRHRQQAPAQRPMLLDQSWNRDAHHLDHLRVQSVAEYLDIVRNAIKGGE